MNRKPMKKEFDIQSKKKSIVRSGIPGIESDVTKESELKAIANICWRSEFEAYETRQSKLKNATIKEVEAENCCLQKMIDHARKEQALLKKAINTILEFSPIYNNN